MSTDCPSDLGMLVIDTSALMAIILSEPSSAACMEALEVEETVVISAGTLAEAMIVAMRRDRADELERLVSGLGVNVAPVTEASARAAATAYARWGEGAHPAGLNLGDCFAYEAAKRLNCPLLYVGDDFAKTDVISALS
jgi:ribonuclease VapC